MSISVDSHSFNDSSNHDTATATTTAATTRSPSVSPTPAPSVFPTSLLLDSFRLRRRRPPAAPRRSSKSLKSPHVDEMFTKKKYSPLPTNSNGSNRKRVGGMPAWKRYGLIGTGALVVIMLMYGYSGRSSKDVDAVWDAESEPASSLED